MNILVVDVPATTGGALTILNEFYEKFKKDSKNHYYFCVSTPSLNNYDNITVLSFPWVKQSWFHRIFFDIFYANKIIKNYNITKIFSLQNTAVPFTKISQDIYLHQPLPFVEYRFHFIENKLMWTYQNIISIIIYYSLKKADNIIVQTQWMKKAVIDKCNISSEKITIYAPIAQNYNNYRYEDTPYSRKTFFYPASPLSYKNHQLILDASLILKKRGISDIKIYFTLSGDENALAYKLKDSVIKENLPIIFLGAMNQDEVFKMYSKSILIFPSYIETYGLPLKEARDVQTIILVSNCLFSHEILQDYEKKYIFDPFSAEELADIMEVISNV